MAVFIQQVQEKREYRTTKTAGRVISGNLVCVRWRCSPEYDKRDRLLGRSENNQKFSVAVCSSAGHVPPDCCQTEPGNRSKTASRHLDVGASGQPNCGQAIEPGGRVDRVGV